MTSLLRGAPPPKKNTGSAPGLFVCFFVLFLQVILCLCVNFPYWHLCCSWYSITCKHSVIYLLVVRSFLRKITTMTIVPTTAHKRTKEPGGTMLVILPILMACILMVHIPLMPMASNGNRSEVTTILWGAQRWKLKPNSKSLEPGSSNIPAQEQWLFRSAIAHNVF